jgi:predicted nucleotidyltransferase
MPVRSSSSSVIVWPKADRVVDDARRWAEAVGRQRPDVLRIGYFGSYARGSASVGSDLDLVAIVTDSTDRFERRGVTWDTTSLLVPADLLVYTEAEWNQLLAKGHGFGRTLHEHTRWLFVREGPLPTD